MPVVGRDQDIARIEQELRAAGSPERAVGSQNYLKSKLEFTGATVPSVRAIVTAWRREHPDLTGQRLTDIASNLWDGPYFECKMAAVILLTDRRKLLEPADATLIERLLRTSGTWALVDGLAADVMGSLVESYPELTATLDRWATDENFLDPPVSHAVPASSAAPGRHSAVPAIRRIRRRHAG